MPGVLRLLIILGINYCALQLTISFIGRWAVPAVPMLMGVRPAQEPVLTGMLIAALLGAVAFVLFAATFSWLCWNFRSRR